MESIAYTILYEGEPRRWLGGTVRQAIILEVRGEPKKIVLKGTSDNVSTSLRMIRSIAQHEVFARDHVADIDAVRRAEAKVSLASADVLRMALGSRPYRVVLPK